MEYLRKQSFYPNQLLVLVGFILTTSTLYFQPIFNDILSLSTSYILIINIILSLSIAGSFIIYYRSPQGSFLLEISQYIIFPVMAFSNLMLQKTDENYINTFIIITSNCFIASCLLLIKILTINQLFINPNLQLLSFRKYRRVFRIVRIFILQLIIPLAAFNISKLVFVTTALIQIVIAIKYICYTNLNAEYAALITSGNLLIGSMFIILDEQYSSFNLITDISILVLFFLKISVMKIILQFKCIRILQQKFKLSPIQKIQEDILFNECFRRVVQSEDKQYSEQFHNFLKIKYFQNLHERFLDQKIYIPIYQRFEEQNVVEPLRKLMIELTLIVKTQQGCCKLLTPSRVITNQQIYEKFLLKLYTKSEPSSNLTKYRLKICQFYISHSCYLNSKFLHYNLIKFCLKLSQQNSPDYLAKNRENKIRYYLENFPVKKQEDKQHNNLLQFQFQINYIKQKIKQFYQNDLKLIGQLRGNRNQISKIENYLYQRANNKQHLDIYFKWQMAENQEFLLSSEFLYLYLVFKVGCCRNIQLTIMEVFQKITVPKYQLQFHKNYTEDQATILVQGCSEADKNFDRIIITNKKFREKFMYQQSLFPRLTVSKLLPAQFRQQHFKHLIRVESETYDTKNHQQLECLIKMNLNNDTFHILGKFRVSIGIFNFAQKTTIYVCNLQRINPSKYVNLKQLKQNAKKATEYYSKRYLQFIKNKQPAVENIIQFNKNIQLANVEDFIDEEIYNIKTEQYQQVDSLQDNVGSQQLFPQQIDQDRNIVKKIQKQANNYSKAIDSQKIIKIVCVISIFIFMLFSILPIQLSYSQQYQINQLLNSSLEYYEKVHDNNYKMGINLLILYGINYNNLFGEQIINEKKYVIECLQQIENNIETFVRDTYDVRITQPKFNQIIYKQTQTYYDYSSQRLINDTESNYLFKQKFILSNLKTNMMNMDKLSAQQQQEFGLIVQNKLDLLTDPYKNGNFHQNLVKNIRSQIANRQQFINKMLIVICLINFIGYLMLVFVHKTIYAQIYETLKLFLRKWRIRSAIRKDIIKGFIKNINQLQDKPLKSIELNRNGKIFLTRSQNSAITTNKIPLNKFDQFCSSKLPDRTISQKQISQYHIENQLEDYQLKRDIPNSMIFKLKIGYFIKLLLLVGIQTAILSVLLINISDQNVLKLQTTEITQHSYNGLKQIYIYQATNWIEYSNISSSRSDKRVKQILDYADNIYQNNNYLGRIDQIQDSQFIRQILNKQVCSIIQNCQKEYPQIVDQKFIQLLPSLIKKEHIIRNIIQENTASKQQIQQLMIYNLQTLQKYLDPSFFKFNLLIYQKLFVDDSKYAQFKGLAFLVLIIVTFIINLHQICLIINRVPKIKQQVLTYDKISNLYSIKQYQPYFNRFLNPQN